MASVHAAVAPVLIGIKAWVGRSQRDAVRRERSHGRPGPGDGATPGAAPTTAQDARVPGVA